MADFPTTSLLSEFVGPDENPLYENGAWAQYADRFPLQRFNNGAIVTEEFAVNGMYWTRDTYIGLAEVWACTSGGGLGAALETWRVALWQDDPDSKIGYLTYYGGGIGEEYVIRRYDGGGSFTGIASLDTAGPSKIGMRLTPTHVECWAYFSGQWNFIVSAADATYRGTFFAAVEMEEQGGIGNLGMGCFGAGVINRQHIYRVIRAKKAVPA